MTYERTQIYLDPEEHRALSEVAAPYSAPSFAVMERVGCSRAARFDRDFAVYRYGAYRKHAFEIVR